MHFFLFQIISSRQNLTLTLSEQTAGTYFCHATVPDFDSITSRGAEVIMNAPPRIRSAPSPQYGVLNKDSFINCASVSVPEPISLVWKFHGKVLNDSE